MYRLLNQANPLLFALLPILVFVMAFYHWGEYSIFNGNHALGSFILRTIGELPGWIFDVIGAVVLVFTASLIASLNATKKITDGRGLVVSVIFLILISAINISLSHPVFISNLIVFFAVYQLLNMGEGQNSVSIAFFSSFLFAFSAYFVPATAFFLPLVWLALIVYGEFTIRQFFVSVFAFMLPFFYSFSIGYLFFNEPFLQNINTFIDFLFVHKSTPTSLAQYSAFMYVVALSIVALIEFSMNYYKLVIIRRKAFRFFVLIAISSPILTFALGSISSEFMVYSALPVSFFLARLLSRISKEWVRSLLFFLLVVFAVWIKFDFVALLLEVL